MSSGRLVEPARVAPEDPHPEPPPAASVPRDDARLEHDTTGKGFRAFRADGAGPGRTGPRTRRARLPRAGLAAGDVHARPGHECAQGPVVLPPPGRAGLVGHGP